MATIYAAFAVATLLLLVLQLATIRIFPRVLQVPPRILTPILLVLMIIGTYVSDNRVFDIWLMLGFGVIGYLLEKFGLPLAPLILGFILGPIFETNLRRALMFSDGNVADFVTRPVSGVLSAVVVVMIALALRSMVRSVRQQPA